MATKSIVPRASGEGGLGTSSKLWKEAHHVTASFGDISMIEDASNRLQVSGGPLVAASGLSGSLTHLSNGSSYLVEGSNISITTGSAGQVTIASPHAGVIEDLNTLGAASADGEFIVATGAGAFAYESGATVRTSLGLAIGSNVQAYDAGLTDIAGLAVSDGNIIVGNGSNWVAESGATARTSLGLGTGNSPTFTGLTLSGDLTVNGTTTTVDTTNLLVEDPVVLLGSGASSANTNGGLALLSGSSVANNSLVIGRVANDTWGVGRKDVTGGTVTTLADMTLVDFKAAAITTAGNITPSAADTYNLGSTSAEWANLYLGDGSYIYFGNDQDVRLQHVADTGLKLELNIAGDGEPILEIASGDNVSSGPSLKLNMQKSAGVNDVVGNIEYLADAGSTDDQTYGSITTTVINKDSTSSFTGDMKFNVVSSGSLHTALLISGSDLRQTGSVDIPGHNATDSGLMLGGTLVTSTASELNLLDGGTSVGSSITIADTDGFIVNDNGTMKTIPASDLSTYVGGAGLSNIVEDTTPQLGGNLDINSKRIQGSLLPSAADTYHLGSSTYEWKDVYLSDLSKVYFGVDQDIYLSRKNNTAMQVKLPSAAAGGPTFEIVGEDAGTQGPNLKLHHNSSSPAANDVLGNLKFAGEASNSTETNYGIVTGEIVDATAGSERGSVIVSVEANSQNTEALKIIGGTSTGESTVDIADHDGSAGGLKLGGTLVTSTAAELNKLDGATITTTELNLLDGGTDVGSPTTTIVDADRFIINDNGTMTHVSASVLKTYIGAGAADDITTGDAAVTIATSAGNITLDAQGNDTDIIFKGTDGSSDTTFLTLDGSEAGAAAFNSNVTVGGDLAVNGDTSTFASANASDPLVIIKNTTNDAAGARLRFVKDKGAAGADNDVAGLIEFYADDDNQDNILFAKVEAAVADASNGAEGGKLTLSVATHDGEIQPGLVLTDGSAEDEVDVTIGNGAASVTTVAGDAKVTGDIILDDGGSLKEAGGTAAFTFDGDGHVTKIGQDSPSSGQFLKWDGSKAVWDAASGGGAGGGKHGLTTTKTADFTTTAFASAEERQLYIVDSSSAVTATLAAPGNTTYDGYEVNIKRFGAGTVHITGSSGVINIDGSSTFDLPSQYSSVTLIATGSQFVII